MVQHAASNDRPGERGFGGRWGRSGASPAAGDTTGEIKTMGEVVRPTASPETIEDHVAQTLKNADRQGGEIAEVAHARLDPAVERAARATTARDTANDATDQAYDVVLACDAVADPVIKKHRDDLWNAIGRVQNSDVMRTVYPGGVGTYTDVEPRLQPSMMVVLEGRIAEITHPKITAEMKAGWVASIRAAREPYAEALKPLSAAEALQNVSDQGWRDSIKSEAVALSRLKRDYRNLGLSEKQIHEIIPDAPRNAKAKTPPKPATPVA
jgi:hypothetical protein